MTDKIGNFGSGIGGPVQTTGNPNNPSFDPAANKNATNTKIQELLTVHDAKLTEWEMKFLSEIYGGERLTRKQHITVGKIYSRCKAMAILLCLLLSGCGWHNGNFDPGCGKIGKGGLLPPPREVREQVRPPERGEPGWSEYWSSQHYRGVDER